MKSKLCQNDIDVFLKSNQAFHFKVSPVFRYSSVEERRLLLQPGLNTSGGAIINVFLQIA
jgi:hypothetical protein